MYMQFIALHQCIVNNLQLMAEWTNSHSVSARVQGILKDDTVEPRRMIQGLVPANHT